MQAGCFDPAVRFGLAVNAHHFEVIGNAGDDGKMADGGIERFEINYGDCAGGCESVQGSDVQICLDGVQSVVSRGFLQQLYGRAVQQGDKDFLI